MLELLQSLFFPHACPVRVGRACWIPPCGGGVLCVSKGWAGPCLAEQASKSPDSFLGPLMILSVGWNSRYFIRLLPRGQRGWYLPHTISGSSFHRRGPLVIALLIILYLVFVGSFGVVKTLTVSSLIASNGENYLRGKVHRVVCKRRITVCMKLLALDCLGRFTSSHAPLSSRPGCP